MPSTAIPARHRLSKAAALLGCSLAAASHANAAIVNINLTNVGTNNQNISGVNAGKTFGSPRTTVTDIFGTSDFGIPDLEIYFNQNFISIDGDNGMYMAYTGGYASIRNFAAGASIDSTSMFTEDSGVTGFLYWPGGSNPIYSAANFGPNSFIGFRFGSGANGTWNYGWFEVLWTFGGTAANSSFQILSGAYESDVGVAILAGATGGGGGGGVPLPGAAGLAACGLLAASRRRRR